MEESTFTMKIMKDDKKNMEERATELGCSMATYIKMLVKREIREKTLG